MLKSNGLRLWTRSCNTCGTPLATKHVNCLILGWRFCWYYPGTVVAGVWQSPAILPDRPLAQPTDGLRLTGEVFPPNYQTRNCALPALCFGRRFAQLRALCARPRIPFVALLGTPRSPSFGPLEHDGGMRCVGGAESGRRRHRGHIGRG